MVTCTTLNEEQEALWYLGSLKSSRQSENRLGIAFMAQSMYFLQGRTSMRIDTGTKMRVSM